MSPRALGPFVAALTALAFAPGAGARTVRDEPYPRETTWNAAIRLIRVDMGCPITERDVDNGYFTFDWRDGRRTVPGSVEVVPTQVDGRPGTRIIVQINAMPGYVESMLLTRLNRKLHQEFGEPPPPPRRAPPAAPPPDAPSPPTVPVRSPTPSEPVDPDPPANPPPPISPDAPRPRRGSAND